LARRLTEIVRDMPLQVDREGLRPQRPDLDSLSAFFDRQNFGPTLRKQSERLAALASAGVG
jgi:hypothetical protein